MVIAKSHSVWMPELKQLSGGCRCGRSSPARLHEWPRRPAAITASESLFFNLYLQEVQGLTPMGAAWWTLPQIVLMIAASNVGPWLNRRFADHTIVVTMLLITTSGFLLYAVLPVTWVGRPLAAGGAALAAFGI
ncbi:hypothetical protein [Nonomuraea sp. JJY05]|uniref:hypothetical protein n=1 Tax=Nonomuraea sp. JJY05 TaxID=3350255 RepID=UPI00373F8DD7